jgi:glycosyltransferase involved in cell wall biosynthesis
MIKTIFINGKFLSSQVTGVQRYALELFRQMDVILQEQEYQQLRVICLAPPDARLRPDWQTIELRRVGFNPGNLWEQLDLPIYARGQLLFSPANTGPLFYSKQVITFHDAAVFAVPAAYSPLFRAKYSIIFQVLARIARLMLTDSLFSQRELSHYLGVPEQRFRVIPLGGDHLSAISVDTRILEKHKLTRNSYLLLVASQSLHKNFARVLLAADQIRATQPADVAFAAAGGSNIIFQQTEAQSLRPNVRMLGYVNDSELKALYENALGFIFPSIYEGFGLPILEAMNCGCPVLCSTAASLPEVAGSAALYFDPNNVAELTALIKQFLREPGLRSDLQVQGREQAKAFSWEKTARITLTELIACL